MVKVKRQVVMLEITTAAENDNPADWNWDALLDNNGHDEAVRVVGAASVRRDEIAEED